MTDQERLEDALLASHSCLSMTTFEEEDAIQLINAAALEMSLDVQLWSCSVGLRDGMAGGGRAVADTTHPAAALCFLLEKENRFVAVMLDSAGYLKDEKTLRLMRDLIEKFTRTGSTLILIDGGGELPTVIRSRATPFELSLPDGTELEKIVRETLRCRNHITPLRVDLKERDLKAIVDNLRGLSGRQARQVILDAVCVDRCFDISDMSAILAGKRRQLRGDGLLDSVETTVSLDEIGGMAHLKRWLSARRDALGEEARQFGIPSPRGVLMLGVQGAGKSLASKAVASAWQRPLLRMDAGALYDKYIGESERRLRDALRQADRMAPIVLWIDEIEKAFASAASQSSDGGLSKRMFGALLTWMQEHQSSVFLVATANDIEALPPELLRKGRFDEIFFVDLPGLEARGQILRIHLQKRGRDPEKFDLADLAKACEGFSGAEIEQAIVAALFDAFAAHTDLTSAGIRQAMEHSPPLSVTMHEKVAALRAWAQNRCVPAD
jgi:AAA+ superfamily predicted ATPase